MNKIELETFKQNLTMFMHEVHNNAVDHGFHDEYRTHGDYISLMHSELSESFEEHRNRKPMVYMENGKPEGIAVELADCVLRILDWAGMMGVDMASIMVMKHEYNKTREYKHGGKLL